MDSGPKFWAILSCFHQRPSACFNWFWPTLPSEKCWPPADKYVYIYIYLFIYLFKYVICAVLLVNMPYIYMCKNIYKYQSLANNKQIFKSATSQKNNSTHPPSSPASPGFPMWPPCHLSAAARRQAQSSAAAPAARAPSTWPLRRAGGSCWGVRGRPG